SSKVHSHCWPSQQWHTRQRLAGKCSRLRSNSAHPALFHLFTVPLLYSRLYPRRSGCLPASRGSGFLKLAHGGEHLRDGQIAHALVMAERTDAFLARTAVELGLQLFLGGMIVL